VRVALLDLYDGEPGRGIPMLTRLIEEADGYGGARVTLDRFDVRGAGLVPSLDYDVYVSSGGPGSPHDGAGTAWEAAYFRWLDAVWQHNHDAKQAGTPPKPAFFVCHSFQMLVRHFRLAEVTERRSESFGVFPVYPTPVGRRDPLFAGLGDPFYAADFRRWQVVHPDATRLRALGATILAVEKVRPHVPLARALMALRLGPHMVGTQFHPEADPAGMAVHVRQEKRRRQIIGKIGPAKYRRLLHRLDAPDYLRPTFARVIPTFLRRALDAVVG
jgi:GMP synthase-like glutamine amidotransferase